MLEAMWFNEELIHEIRIKLGRCPEKSLINTVLHHYSFKKDWQFLFQSILSLSLVGKGTV